MRVKKYLALLFAAILATTMLTGCPWDIEDDAASDSSGAPSSSSRPSHDSSDDDNDSGSAPSSPSTPEQPSDDEESGEPENPGDEEPTPTDIIEKYGTVKGDTLTLTTGTLYSDFRPALNNAPTITKIAFDDDVTSISNSAFDSCTNLTSVDLGSIQTIGGGAFFGCTNLASIDLSNVTSIDASAFFGCTALTSVDLTSATQIDPGAFLACTNLTDIRLGADMHALSSNQSTGVHPDAFKNIADTVHVYYGTSKEEAQAKWEELDLTMASGTQVEYLPASEWENRENSDNAADALPGAMKGLLALAERLG